MIRLAFFVLFSIPIICISWRSILSFKNHGLYRLISWECILWLIISNIIYWFTDPFSINQVISWILLFLSLFYIISGAIIMKKANNTDNKRDQSLYNFEKTSEIIETGLFKYIRHPLYSSLLFLTWGIFLKHPDYLLLIISVLSTATLIFTAKVEEQENIRYFGDQYRAYMKKTRMFIPFVL